MPRPPTNGNSGEVVDLDLTNERPSEKATSIDLTTEPWRPPPRTEKWDPQRAKTLAGQSIAMGIVIIFGVSVVYSVGVTSLAVWQSSAATSGVKEFGEGLDAIAKFGTTLFSPLLSFILGYYFGEKNSPQAGTPAPNGGGAGDDGGKSRRKASADEEKERKSEPTLGRKPNGDKALVAAEVVPADGDTAAEHSTPEQEGETRPLSADKTAEQLPPTPDDINPDIPGEGEGGTKSP